MIVLASRVKFVQFEVTPSFTRYPVCEQAAMVVETSKILNQSFVSQNAFFSDIQAL